jgi:predicted nuclease with TOPRIM domain
VIARTFREVQVQAGQQRAELAGQKERLEARLAELKRVIGRLARSDGNDGALAAELRGLKEEYGETQNRLEDVGHAVEALGSGGPTEGDVREALEKLDPLWDELFPAEKERIVNLLVEEVVVNPKGLLIRLRLKGLNSLVA